VNKIISQKYAMGNSCQWLNNLNVVSALDLPLYYTVVACSGHGWS
jgi:hypothetical protein